MMWVQTMVRTKGLSCFIVCYIVKPFSVRVFEDVRHFGALRFSSVLLAHCHFRDHCLTLTDKAEDTTPAEVELCLYSTFECTYEEGRACFAGNIAPLYHCIYMRLLCGLKELVLYN